MLCTLVVVSQISAASKLTWKSDQVGNTDLKYKKMGLIGTMKMVSFLADVNISPNISSSQVRAIIIHITVFIIESLFIYLHIIFLHKLATGISC